MFGHITTQCPSKTRTLIIETQSDSDQDDLEEIVHDPEGDIWKDKLVVDQTTTLGCLRVCTNLRLIMLARLPAVLV